MALMPRFGPPDGDADIRAYSAIVTQAFAGERDSFEFWLRGFGRDIRVLRENEVVGGLVFYDMGQYFGGRSVRTWGIAGVAIAPEQRGKGLGRELMQACLRENCDSGPSLSTLYPAAPSLYRQLGWEFAGSRLMYACRVADLPAASSAASVRAATEADEAAIACMYAGKFSVETGSLDRSDAIWRRVRRVPVETPLYGCIAEEGERTEGYAMYLQKRDGSGNARFDIHVRDLVCLTGQAKTALLANFARHASVAEMMYFFAAPHDPLLQSVLRGPHVRVHDRQDWMLRVVRVKEALESRGYSPQVSAEATLQVRDETLPGNAGNWKLRLNEGVMEVGKGGRGGPTIDVGGLAALYSGSLSPAQLRAAGLLHGTDKHDAALAAMFSGPAPWMPDYF